MQHSDLKHHQMKEAKSTFYSVNDVAKALNVSARTILREIQDGRIAAVKVRRLYRVCQGEMNEYIERLHRDT